jgi:hypothetical protein
MAGGRILDDYLVVTAKAGDRKAFELLARRWERKLVAHAWRVSGSVDQAQEAAQAAWLEIVRSLRTLQDERAFPAWAALRPAGSGGAVLPRGIERRRGGGCSRRSCGHGEDPSFARAAQAARDVGRRRDVRDLDNLIGAALDAEERELLHQIGDEPGFVRQALGLFGGRTGWVAVLLMIVQSVAFIAGVWAAYHFFKATDTLSALRWGLPAAVLLLMALTVKLSMWPSFEANRLMRELKRMQLQIAATGRKDPAQ